ncbi:hypothetical protein JOC94_001926 [Bacillus thermophilus]|uniref:Lipopolysaccharide biosynthesis protein n=1 Tax=Siminovitchia thermophila TaxID=1245522 RepID=A0ABS2R742_9BACI|nr:hypothetical protein [Siminovitchia thermophila]MBM7714954.1 hypothetical protein [Siminovitchia thermophila]
MSGQETEKYTFYEYLIFFWKKKWLIPIMPILLMIIAGIISTQGKTYTGTSIVYVGSVTKETWLEPDLIQRELDKELKQDLDYTITKGEKRTTLSIEGTDKKQVINSLKRLTNLYHQKVNGIYKEMHRSKEDELNYSKKYLLELEESAQEYKNALKAPNTDTSLEARYFDLLREIEKRKYDYLQKINEIEGELIQLEEPRVLDTAVNDQGGNLKANLLIATVFGLFLSVLLLVLMKYMADARRVKKA